MDYIAHKKYLILTCTSFSQIRCIDITEKVYILMCRECQECVHLVQKTQGKKKGVKMKNCGFDFQKRKPNQNTDFQS